jgi:hypothetical protein
MKIYNMDANRVYGSIFLSNYITAKYNDINTGRLPSKTNIMNIINDKKIYFKNKYGNSIKPTNRYRCVVSAVQN